MKRFNERGATLLEIMFALGILIIGTYLVVEGVNQMENSSKETQLLSTTERQINTIVDNIRTSLGNYQITYDPKAVDTLLALNSLPMAWAPGVVLAVKDCSPTKSCPPNRFGFVIVPVAGLGSRGLYKVTLRMTNAEWKEPFREYHFLATVQ